MNDGTALLRAFLDKHHCCASVRERVSRLNPTGCVMGSRIRGWYRREQWWWTGHITPQQFIAAQGVVAYRAVDPRWWQRRGLSKAMRREDYLDNIWKYPFGARAAGAHQFFETPR